MNAINWDALPEGEWTAAITTWSDQDKDLASLAVLIHRNLMARISGEAFIKHPQIVSGIANSMKLVPDVDQLHVGEVLATALVLETLSKIPS